MKKKITLLTCILVSSYGFSQVGINTENPQSTLHVTPANTDGSTAEGIIAPNLTRAQLISKDSKYTSALQGSIVYVTTIDGVVSTKTANVTSVGYYYFDGQLWQTFKGDVASQPWNKVGTTSVSTINTDNSYLNAQVVVGGTTPASVNGGTNNAQFTVSGGDASINGLTVGKGKGNQEGNTVVGLNSLGANTTGNFNTAVGVSSLLSMTTGDSNVAIGSAAGSNLTSGSDNTFVGRVAATNQSSGSNNIAIGSRANLPNLTGSNQMNIGNAIYGATSATAAAGSVSIGKTAPDAGVRLDVNGKTQLNDLRYANGTQGSGKILTSDASGNATWTSMVTEQNNVEIYGGQAKIPPHNKGEQFNGTFVPDWTNHANAGFDTPDWIIVSKTSTDVSFVQQTTAPYGIVAINPAKMQIVYEYTGEPFDLTNLYPILTAGNNSNYPDSFSPVFIKLENVNNKTRLTVQVIRIDNFATAVASTGSSNWSGSFLLNILLAKKQ